MTSAFTFGASVGGADGVCVDVEGTNNLKVKKITQKYITNQNG